MMDTKKIFQVHQIISYALCCVMGYLLLGCTTAMTNTNIYTNDTSSIDSSIRYGKLPNGFSYFIKSLPTPQPKLYMRLYHKAGTNEEDSDQFDVAHGIEHLAFKSTKHFPKGIGQSESIKTLGISIYDMLAYSGQTTEYFFDAPADKKKALETAFLFYRDIANGLNLTDEDISSVKGELKQEFLIAESGDLSQFDANSKLTASFFPCRNEESNFLERLEAQTPDAFRRFYRDWYRPDLFAISIVGNIKDIEALEEQIRSYYSDLKLPKNFRDKTNCDSLFIHREPQYSVINRNLKPSKNLPDTKVELEILFRDSVTMNTLSNLNGIKRLALMQFLREIAAERLSEITSEYPYGSFTIGFRDAYKSVQLPSTLSIRASFDNSIGEKQALHNILRVLLQLQRFGVTEEEWRSLKKRQLQYLEDRDENSAEYWIDEIKNFYTRGEALPNNKNAVLKQWLTDLSMSQFNDFVRQFLSKEPEDIGIIAPTDHPALKITEQKVRSWLEEAYQNNIEPYKRPATPVALISSKDLNKFKNPEIIEIGTSKIGSKEYILGNGIKLVIKQIKGAQGIDQDQIKIHGYSLKGTNCFPEDQFFSTIYASSIVNYSGLNGMKKDEISRFLEKYQMLLGVVSPYIDLNESGIQGSASKENFELVLQLIYLHFTKPNKDQLAFEDWKQMKQKTFQYQSTLEFGNAIRSSTGTLSVMGDVFGYKSLTGGTKFLEGIEKINYDQAFEIYRKLFGNAEDFTFVISGDFNIDSILPLAAEYLGNLPNNASIPICSETLKEPVLLSAIPKFQELVPPVSEMSNYLMYNISFFKNAPLPLNWMEQLKVEALGWITTEKAWRLRFEMGLELYDVRVWSRFNNNLNRYELSSTFNCVPEQYPIIRKEMHNIFSEIKSGDITEELFEQGMYAMHLFYDLDKRGGRHTKQHQNLYKYYRFGQPWMDPAEVEKFINSLTIEDIVKAANKYYKEENMYEFLMSDKKMD